MTPQPSHRGGVEGKLHLSSLYLQRSSSTAQGGGGSFKNRKPLGEVGCCELRMAEPSEATDGPTGGWVSSLSLSFFL